MIGARCYNLSHLINLKKRVDAMSQKTSYVSREVALESFLIVSRYFFHTEHLHYGYWNPELEVDFHNLPLAQKNYCDFLFSRIPEKVNSILDVGCGIGTMAKDLIDRGYSVDCVSPSEELTVHARHRIGGEGHVFECRFEDIKTENCYDMMLFSESFQYVNPNLALLNSLKLLNPNGYLLICDSFRKNEAGKKGNLRGGCRLDKFYNLISTYQLKMVKDIDITAETAPNLDLANDFLQNFAHPIWDILLKLLVNKYPITSKLILRKYRQKLDKINKRYFSGERTSIDFTGHNSYRFILCQKQDSTNQLYH